MDARAAVEIKASFYQPLSAETLAEPATRLPQILWLNHAQQNQQREVSQGGKQKNARHG
jgi:hypothetical protein